jgi:hypothetical protein
VLLGTASVIFNKKTVFFIKNPFISHAPTQIEKPVHIGVRKIVAQMEPAVKISGGIIFAEKIPAYGNTGINDSKIISRLYI